MAILDGGLRTPEGLVRLARALARGGIRVFQLRWKGGHDRAVIGVALRIGKAVPGCSLLLNDRVDLAVAAGAAGVHLGAEDLPAAVARHILGPGRVVGLSAGTPAEVARAVAARPDYVSLGPAFRTGTKADAGRPLGPRGVRRLRRLVPAGLPVLAVGGINSDNGASLVTAGVTAVAVASWWPRPKRAARAACEMLAAVRGTGNAAGRQGRTTRTW